MTQEEKLLLLVDLCARLPYGVKIHGNFQWGSEDEIFDDIQTKVLDIYDIDWIINNIEIKPYLFPLSSMNLAQRIEYSRTLVIFDESHCSQTPETYDWLNKNHFDYRGLIEKGLAINCTNLNIY